jgi:hypothetical protein
MESNLQGVLLPGTQTAHMLCVLCVLRVLCMLAADNMDIDDLPEGLLEDQGPHFAE